MSQKHYNHEKNLRGYFYNLLENLSNMDFNHWSEGLHGKGPQDLRQIFENASCKLDLPKDTAMNRINIYFKENTPDKILYTNITFEGSEPNAKVTIYNSFRPNGTEEDEIEIPRTFLFKDIFFTDFEEFIEHLVHMLLKNTIYALRVPSSETEQYSDYFNYQTGCAKYMKLLDR